VLGGTPVGKSAWVLNLVGWRSKKGTELPRGAAAGFVSKLVTIPYDGEEMEVKLGVWDTLGSELLRKLTRSKYQGCHAAVVMYDLFDRNSFEGAQKWKKDFDEFGEVGAPVLLVGNKMDLAEFKAPVISEQEAQRVVLEQGFFSHALVSAKTGENVESPLLHLVAHAVSEMEEKQKAANQSDSESPHTRPEEKKSGPGCIVC